MFIFYSEGAGAYWIMPSLELIKQATCNKEGAHAGKYSIMFTNEHKDGKPHPRPRFEPWHDNWDAFKTMASNLQPPTVPDEHGNNAGFPDELLPPTHPAA